MNVGFDVDGVLAGFAQGVLDRAKVMGLESEFPRTADDIDCWNIAPRFAEVMEDVWTDEEFWLNLEPLVTELPFPPACYITSRQIPSSVTEQWLDNNGFPKALVITVSHPREKLEHIIRLQLDLFVDDLHHTVRDIIDAGYNAVLLKTPYQRGHEEECEGLPTIERLEDLCIR